MNLCSHGFESKMQFVNFNQDCRFVAFLKAGQAQWVTANIDCYYQLQWDTCRILASTENRRSSWSLRACSCYRIVFTVILVLMNGSGIWKNALRHLTCMTKKMPPVWRSPAAKWNYVMTPFTAITSVYINSGRKGVESREGACPLSRKSLFHYATTSNGSATWMKLPYTTQWSWVLIRLPELYFICFEAWRLLPWSEDSLETGFSLTWFHIGLGFEIWCFGLSLVDFYTGLSFALTVLHSSYCLWSGNSFLQTPSFTCHV